MMAPASPRLYPVVDPLEYPGRVIAYHPYRVTIAMMINANRKGVLGEDGFD